MKSQYYLHICLDRESLSWAGFPDHWTDESPLLFDSLEAARAAIPEAIEALKPGMGWASSDRPSILIMDHDEDGGMVEEIYLDTFK
jgi:hypothetical protein